jgi:Tol biopolymer transport system component
VRYSDQDWGSPAPLPVPINSEGKEWRGSTTTDGIIYLGSDRAQAGLNQIYRAYRDAGQNWVAEKLPAPINTNSYEGDPCVAPDGRFLVFYSARDGKSADLYVCFSDGQGSWGAPVSLGPAFNSQSDEYGAHLSADGKCLFFTRHSARGNTIFWVATTAIDKLKR